MYNNMTFFQGRWIAHDIKVEDGGQLRTSLRVDEVEDLSTINESDFAPAVSATGPVSPRLVVKSGEAQLRLTRQVPPHYPDKAKSDHVQGTVKMQALIGKDGHVVDLRPQSGPAILQKAAVDAASQWTYRPFLVDGKAVEVETEIIINFSLG